MKKVTIMTDSIATRSGITGVWSSFEDARRHAIHRLEGRLGNDNFSQADLEEAIRDFKKTSTRNGLEVGLVWIRNENRLGKITIQRVDVH